MREEEEFFLLAMLKERGKKREREGRERERERERERGISGLRSNAYYYVMVRVDTYTHVKRRNDGSALALCARDTTTISRRELMDVSSSCHKCKLYSYICHY